MFAPTNFQVIFVHGVFGLFDIFKCQVSTAPVVVVQLIFYRNKYLPEFRYV